MSILYIDDDPEDIEIFGEAVKAVDPSIEYNSFTRCSAAIDFLQAADNLPDHIVMDINMPGIDGRACLQQLRKEPKFDKTRIIVYSTNGFPTDVEYFESLRATFVRKAHSFHDLCELIRRLKI